MSESSRYKSEDDAPFRGIGTGIFQAVQLVESPFVGFLGQFRFIDAVLVAGNLLLGLVLLTQFFLDGAVCSRR